MGVRPGRGDASVRAVGPVHHLVAGAPAHGLPFIWALIGFAATGPLLFVRRFQVWVLTPVLGARRPTESEESAIAPLWNEIVRSNGLPDDRYVVRILPSDELNAFACGGHLVVVTSFAVEELTTPELQGVLAHELSHHLGLHTVAITIGHWLSTPVVFLARIGVFLENVAIAARESYGRDSPLIDMVTNAAASGDPGGVVGLHGRDPCRRRHSATWSGTSPNSTPTSAPFEWGSGASCRARCGGCSLPGITPGRWVGASGSPRHIRRRGLASPGSKR